MKTYYFHPGFMKCRHPRFQNGQFFMSCRVQKRVTVCRRRDRSTPNMTSTVAARLRLWFMGDANYIAGEFSSLRNIIWEGPVSCAVAQD